MDMKETHLRLSLLAISGLWLAFAGCSEPAPPTTVAPSDNSSSSTVHVNIPQHGFTIDVPPGFKESGGLLYWSEYRASIGFTFAPEASYDTVVAEFTPEGLKSAGFTLIERSEVTVNNASGILVRVSRDRDAAESQILAFPSAGGTAQVQATISEPTEEASKLFQAALLTVTHQPPTPNPNSD